MIFDPVLLLAKIPRTAKVGSARIVSSDELLFGSEDWDYSGLRSELSNGQGKTTLHMRFLSINQDPFLSYSLSAL